MKIVVKADHFIRQTYILRDRVKVINIHFPIAEMKIVVKAAHFIRQTYILRDRVKGALHTLGGLSVASLLRGAEDALFERGDCIYKIRGEVFVHDNIFNDIYAQCSKEEDREVLRISLTRSRVIRDYRFQVALSVEPSMEVGTLKSLLKASSWIPEKNFLLVKKGESLLGDDKSTLNDCGIEEEDSVLLACMGGSYPLTLYHYDPPEPNKEFVIPISSCFETGGIVRQYLRCMPEMSRGVQMVTWTDDEKKLIESASL